MLARTAEYLFWTGRYLERAEDTARLLDVTYHRLLEAVPGHEHEAWLDVLRSVGLDDEYERTGRPVTPDAVSAFLVVDPTNQGSIRQCVTQARTNARGVRELLAVELWEALNSLHLDLQARDLVRDVRLQPHELYGFIRQGVQSVIGVADGTWVRDDAWRFFMLGLLLERAEMGVRSLRIRQSHHRDDDVHEWYATLRAASALGASGRSAQAAANSRPNCAALWYRSAASRASARSRAACNSAGHATSGLTSARVRGRSVRRMIIASCAEFAGKGSIPVSALNATSPSE